jgi:hypothetical protein
VYIITVSLENPAIEQPSQEHADGIRDLLWANLDPAWGIEHIRVKADRNALNLSLFLHGDDRMRSSRQDPIIENIMSSLKRLTGWRRRLPDTPA